MSCTNCNRKGSNECPNKYLALKPVLIIIYCRMCYACCLVTDNFAMCAYHMAKKKKKDGIYHLLLSNNIYKHFIEEERYIDEALGLNKKREVRRFHHIEDRLTNFGQTVVIWCFRDFCQNKKYIVFKLHDYGI